MPRTEKVNQQIRDERKEQILVDLERLFLEKGLANIKISDLARASGMSQGLFYHYFANKEEVFAALTMKNSIGMKEQFKVLEQTGTVSQKIYRLTESLLVYIKENPVREQIIQHALTSPGKSQENARELIRYMKGRLRTLIIEGQLEGTVVQDSPDDLVLLYFSCLRGLTSGILTDGINPIETLPTAAMILRLFKP